jgi:hypothetical protein
VLDNTELPWRTGWFREANIWHARAMTYLGGATWDENEHTVWVPDRHATACGRAFSGNVPQRELYPAPQEPVCEACVEAAIAEVARLSA